MNQPQKHPKSTNPNAAHRSRPPQTKETTDQKNYIIPTHTSRSSLGRNNTTHKQTPENQIKPTHPTQRKAQKLPHTKPKEPRHHLPPNKPPGKSIKRINRNQHPQTYITQNHKRKLSRNQHQKPPKTNNPKPQTTLKHPTANTRSKRTILYQPHTRRNALGSTHKPSKRPRSETRAPHPQPKTKHKRPTAPKTSRKS